MAREKPVKVSVVEFADRPHYQMQWRCPITNKKKTKSTGIERTGRKAERAEAEKVAGKFEAELREGRFHEPTRVTWEAFREVYEREHLPSLAKRTAEKRDCVFNLVEEILQPERLMQLTEARLSHLQATMRAKGQAEDTIKGHLAHLKAALGWAHRMGMLPKMPRIDLPKRAKGSKLMKGRPISGEEFDRLLAAIPKVVLPTRKGDVTTEQVAQDRDTIASWEFYLQGLWLSGLRLSESLELWWDRDDRLCVDLTGEHPTLRIPAELEKGHQDRLLPMAPEFAEFLLAIPKGQRTGPVFNPGVKLNRSPRVTAHHTGKVVQKLGKLAGVKVSTDTRSSKVKFASAHDLRRSFGERWASRVMPQILKELMRHESIDTTLKFYVGRNAQTTAKTLWAAHRAATSNTFGNSGQKSAKEVAAEFAATDDAQAS